MNATQNLALYCASAVLEEFPTGDYSPPLPAPGERASNTGSTLTTTVEPWRKLMYINMWLLEKFDQATQEAFANSMRVPTWDLQVPDFDPKTRSLVTMAAGPQFVIPPNHLPLPEGIQGVREWVYHLPLRTAERIMKLINKDSRDWALDINQSTSQLSHVYTTCAWGLRRHPSRAGASDARSRIATHLLFVVQSPWLLSPVDFTMFCERSMYRHYAKKDPKTGKLEVTQLDYVDKLWATIYDDCVRGNTHYFVLTTYNQWAFGAFSRGWTTAWVTPPKPYNAGNASAPGPTILQSLLFWMHSAQQFSLSEQSTTRQERTRDVRSDEGLPTPISPTRERSPSELDFESETDDNTLDKGWLNEMRTNVREIKDLKGAATVSVNRSWIIPEVSDYYISWYMYEDEFRARAGLAPMLCPKGEPDLFALGVLENGHGLGSSKSPSCNFCRPCTILELRAGGNITAVMAVAKACRIQPPV
ncbi:hypothetical protein RhiJN_14505 [Ceratobasidium sp. AG-Ba]|nr:hypothetical protein RhiJN_14505 [Ceratobasidium sp. AG-Ba]QRW15048.1 hypothetical protein RhiLY_14047 [Ceratobasidium sp. AG-Ba]